METPFEDISPEQLQYLYNDYHRLFFFSYMSDNFLKKLVAKYGFMDAFEIWFWKSQAVTRQLEEMIKWQAPTLYVKCEDMPKDL